MEANIEKLKAYHLYLQEESLRLKCLTQGVQDALDILDGKVFGAFKFERGDETGSAAEETDNSDERTEEDTALLRDRTLKKMAETRKVGRPKVNHDKPVIGYRPSTRARELLTEILALQKAKRPVTRNVLAEKMACTSSNVNALLAPLIANDYVSEEKDGRTFYYVALKDLEGEPLSFAERSFKRDDGVTVVPPAHSAGSGYSAPDKSLL